MTAPAAVETPVDEQGELLGEFGQAAEVRRVPGRPKTSSSAAQGRKGAARKSQTHPGR